MKIKSITRVAVFFIFFGVSTNANDVVGMRRSKSFCPVCRSIDNRIRIECFSEDSEERHHVQILQEYLNTGQNDIRSEGVVHAYESSFVHDLPSCLFTIHVDMLDTIYRVWKNIRNETQSLQNCAAYSIAVIDKMTLTREILIPGYIVVDSIDGERYGLGKWHGHGVGYKRSMREHTVQLHYKFWKKLGVYGHVNECCRMIDRIRNLYQIAEKQKEYSNVRAYLYWQIYKCDAIKKTKPSDDAVTKPISNEKIALYNNADNAQFGKDVASFVHCEQMMFDEMCGDDEFVKEILQRMLENGICTKDENGIISLDNDKHHIVINVSTVLDMCKRCFLTYYCCHDRMFKILKKYVVLKNCERSCISFIISSEQGYSEIYNNRVIFVSQDSYHAEPHAWNIDCGFSMCKFWYNARRNKYMYYEEKQAT